MLSGTHPHYKSTIVHSLCHCCAFKLRPQSCGSRFFMNTGHKRSITQGIVGLNLDDCPPTNPPRFHPWYCHLPPTARALVLPRIAQPLPSPCPISGIAHAVHAPRAPAVYNLLAHVHSNLMLSHAPPSTLPLQPPPRHQPKPTAKRFQIASWS